MAVDMGNHMAPLSAHHTCAVESDFKRPHPPNIGGDIWWDRWLAWHVVGDGFGGVVVCVPR